MNFCTIGDEKYILKGLALYKSLCDTGETHFILHWLCIDQETFHTLNKLRDKYPIYKKIKLYSLENYEYGYPELRQAKNNPPSNYGTQYSQYCWCLAPWFTNYILERLKKDDYLLYIDNDIYFYDTPQIIIDAMKGRSIGIHTHRFTGTFEERDNGWYNVGIVVFKSNNTGIRISRLWKEWLLNPSNEYYKKYGTCGDQKYLELFPVLAGLGNVCVFDEEAKILHYAPWCTHDGEPGHTALFFHFSHFTFDPVTGKWTDSLHGEWNPSAQPGMMSYYKDYFAAISGFHAVVSTIK